MTGLARPGVFYRYKMFLCRDREWPNEEVLCCDRAILCRDIVDQAEKKFCRDGGFLGYYRVGQDTGALSLMIELRAHNRHARETGM